MCIVLAAFAIQRAATGSWGVTSAADGSRVMVSVVGLTRLTAPGVIGGEAVACRWWPPSRPPSAEATLCAAATDAAPAYRALRSAYPLLTMALWLAVATLFLMTLRLPRPPAVRVAGAWIVAGMTGLAIQRMMSNAGPALDAISQGSVRFSQSGFYLAVAAVVLSLLAGWLHLRDGVNRPTQSA